MSERRSLPKWDSSHSDGCSALALGSRAFRLHINSWLFRDFPDATHACEAHDEAYYYGGSKQDRLDADLALDAAWKQAGVSRTTRAFGHRAIRLFGGPASRTPDVSWAFGGDFFEYSEEPATPEAEGEEPATPEAEGGDG